MLPALAIFLWISAPATTAEPASSHAIDPFYDNDDLSPAKVAKEQPKPAAPAQFVFTADIGVNTIAFFPRAASGDLTAFFGASLPGARLRRPRSWIAIGVRAMASFGSILLNNNLDRYLGGVHMHLAVTGAAGRRSRLAYSAGLGPVFGFGQAAAAHAQAVTPYGVEVEGRIGYILDDGSATRAMPMFGGMLRLSVQPGDRTLGPVPLIGLFLGLAIAPSRPAR